MTALYLTTAHSNNSGKVGNEFEPKVDQR